MRAPALLSVVSCCFASLAHAGLPVDGIVDPSFGNAGLMRIDPAASGLSNADFVQDVARAATSGRFYVLGSFGDLMLARVDANGALDASFGAGGYSTLFPDLPNEHTHSIRRVSVSSNGKPMVVGSFTELEDGVGDTQGLICRYTVSGSPDAGFDSEGCRLFELDVGGSKTPDTISAIVALPGEAVLIAGTAGTSGNTNRVFIAKLLANGSYDTDFGLGGLRYFAFPDSDLVRAEEIALGTDGRIFVAGGRRSGGVSTGYIAAFDADGDPLANYGVNGIAHFSFAAEFVDPANVAHYATGLVVSADGEATHCGYVRDFSTTQLLLALARFDVDGEPANEFDGDGRLITSYSELNAINAPGPCVLDNQGRLTLAMHTGATGAYDPELALMRFRADGSTDEDFHGAGRLKLPLNLGINGNGSELVGGLIAQGDDLVLFGTATLKQYVDQDNTPHEFVALRIRNDRNFSDSFEAND